MITTTVQPIVSGGTATSVPASVVQPNPAVTPVNGEGSSGQHSAMESAASPVGAATRGTRVSDNRRSNKPIMEKRRRARINNCLNELKTLILDAMKKDPARHSKLEKADILEMTVKYLQNLQMRPPQTVFNVSEPSAMGKFRSGFTECASEVGRFPDVDPVIKRKLLQHLANHLTQTCKVQETPQVQVHILPNPQRSPEQQVPQSGIIWTNLGTNGSGPGMQLVSTRLPNGDLALVLPASAQNHQPISSSQVPLLVPIVPERSASAVSAASSSSYSPSNSPDPVDSMYCTTQQKPLSLVVRKSEHYEENDNGETGGPWRPW
ncbi:protein hairy-like [Euwallacea fornicatus]|uniref:protein hairy-like n=1 Tax=Euwallacea fornicatus TaxID=995702 RepID=UPI00338E98F8